MEKYLYSEYPRRLFSRLLIFLIYTCFFLCCGFFALSANELTQFADLRFEALDEQNGFFAQNDCSFILRIPDVQPVETELPYTVFPYGVVLSSAEKTDALDFNGTQIIYTLRFERSGFYALEPVKILIRGIYYDIPFPEVGVRENIRLLKPDFFFIVPQKQAYEAQRISVGIAGRYFDQVQSVHWTLSEDALVEKGEDSPQLPLKTERISSKTETVAFLSVTPLKKGKLDLPEVEIQAYGYDGKLYTVKPHLRTLQVLQNPARSENKNAHTKSEKNDGKKDGRDTDMQKEPTVIANTDFAAHLAQLRYAERRSPLFWRYKNERKGLEQSAGLKNPDEISLWLCIILPFALCACTLVFLILFYKKTVRAAFAAVLFMSAFVYAVSSLVKINERVVVSSGGMLRTIPENTASAVMNLTAGVRLRVMRSGGAWYLVSDSQRRIGWILKEECVYVGKEK